MGYKLVWPGDWAAALKVAWTRFADTGLLPDVFGKPIVGVDQTYEGGDRSFPMPLEDIDLPPHDSADPVQRALIAGVLTSLHAGGEDETPLEYRLDILAWLREYLAKTEFTLSNLSEIRWELRAGLAAFDYQRVRTCCLLWNQLNNASVEIAIDTAAALLFRIMVGKEYFDPVWISQEDPAIADDTFNPIKIGPILTYCHATAVRGTNPFAPAKPGGRYTAETELEQILRAKQIDPWSGLPLQQAEEDRLSLIECCRAILLGFSNERLAAAPHRLAFAAWCDYAVGALRSAPTLIDHAAQTFAGIEYPAHPQMTTFALRSAADCYQLNGDIVEAERQIRRWVELRPDDAQAYKRLAEVLHRQERVSEVVDAYENFIRLRGDDKEERWEDSLILRLGLEAKGGRRLLIASAAEKTDWAPMGQALAEWHHPWLARLCPDARRRWWAGLYMLSMPVLREHLGEASVWEMAADAFGEAVAMELRHSVLQPFREAHPGEPSTTPLPDHWKKAREGRATLGNLLHCLMNAKYPPLPVARSFSAWLQQHKKPLFEYICRRDVDLLRLARLRGSAQHDTVTLAEARQVFEDAARLLQHIVPPETAPCPPA